jgi:hypothetical protein
MKLQSQRSKGKEFKPFGERERDSYLLACDNAQDLLKQAGARHNHLPAFPIS